MGEAVELDMPDYLLLDDEEDDGAGVKEAGCNAAELGGLFAVEDGVCIFLLDGKEEIHGGR